jgi:hypothetical protein
MPGLCSVRISTKWKVWSSCWDNLNYILFHRFWIYCLESVRTEAAFLKNNGRLCCFILLSFLRRKKKAYGIPWSLSFCVSTSICPCICLFIPLNLLLGGLWYHLAICVSLIFRRLVISPCYLFVLNFCQEAYDITLLSVCSEFLLGGFWEHLTICGFLIFVRSLTRSPCYLFVPNFC